LTSFAQIVLFLLLLGSDLCELARKTRIICTIQKSDALCFQGLLRFVSTFLVFSPTPPDLRQPGNLEPCRIPAPQTQAGTRVAPKGSNSVFNARIVQSILSSF